MNTFEVDPQYPHGQCVSVDRIEYEIGRRGYYRHPRLGKLHAHTISRRELLALSVIWAAMFVVLWASGDIRAAHWRNVAEARQEEINRLQPNHAQLASCLASMGRVQQALNAVDAAAHHVQKTDPNDPAMRLIIRITAALRGML